MKTIILLITLVLLACGKNESSTTGTETPLVTVSNEEAAASAPSRYTYRCRPVDEVQGGNFDFFWAFPRPGEIEELKLHPEKKFLNLRFLSAEAEYTSRITRRENRFDADAYELIVPEVPTGTIRGTREEYTILELAPRGREPQTFLCPEGLRTQMGL